MRDQAEPSWQRVAPSRATQMNAVEFADGALFFLKGAGSDAAISTTTAK
jgi:hypothetical protein